MPPKRTLEEENLPVKKVKVDSMKVVLETRVFCRPDPFQAIEELKIEMLERVKIFNASQKNKDESTS